MPTARWETVEVDFPGGFQDVVIPHSLNPRKPHEVRFIVVDTNAFGGATLTRGLKAPGSDYIVLRTGDAARFRIRLFIEADAEDSEPLPAGPID